MSFADSLRGSDNSKLNSDKYNLDYHGVRIMHSWVRGWCEDHRTQRRADGYLMETYDSDSGWSLRVFGSLYRAVRPGTGWDCGKQYSALNGYPLLDAHGYLRSCVQVMSENEAIAYMAAELKKKLTEDGFRSIRVEKVPCHEVYDTYRQKGGFFSKAETVHTRVETGKLLGYALKFHVEW